MRLWLYSAVSSVVCTGVAFLGTCWMPAPWETWAWISLTGLLCVGAGLLYRYVDPDPPS